MAGVALLVLGILIIAGYGLYYFAIAGEIPVVIRAAVILIILGLVVVLLSLARERLEDIRGEKEHKGK
jgi:lysylphosphatidylglycerol synthetase-like protein (DUF2156 family)